MFGCIGRLLYAILLILFGAMLHAQWPLIKRHWRDRVPELFSEEETARTIVWVEVVHDRVIVRGIR